MKKSVVVFGDMQLFKKFQKPMTLRTVAYFMSVQSLTVSVEMKLGLRKLARRAGIKKACIDLAIRTKNFPPYDGPLTATYWLIHFQRVLSGPEVLRVLTALGYLPATLREVLSFWEILSVPKRERLLQRLDLVALGSQIVHQHLDEDRVDECVPYIGRWNGSHKLKLSGGTSFSRHDAFLIRSNDSPEA